MSADQKKRQEIEESSEQAERAFTFRTIFWLGVLLVVSIGAIYVFSVILLGFSINRRPATPPVSNPTALPELPQPALQVVPPEDLAQYTEQEQMLLESYAWVDKDAGIARIPIDEAMQILAETGLPTALVPAIQDTGRVEVDESGFVHPTLAPQSTPGPQQTEILPPSATIAISPPAQAEPPSAAGDPQSGRDAFEDLGCTGCHEAPGDIAPSLQGVYGSEVQLESGETVLADEAYIRESILNPKEKVVAGFRSIMPNFQNIITPQQIEDLIAYIKSIGTNQ